MSTVTVDVPDDLDDDLERLVEKNPQFETKEEMLTEFVRGILEMEEATENVKHATDAAEFDEPEQALDALKTAQEANMRGMEAILKVFGVRPRLSDEVQKTVRESEQDFENGDYVDLKEV